MTLDTASGSAAMVSSFAAMGGGGKGLLGHEGEERVFKRLSNSRSQDCLQDLNTKVTCIADAGMASVCVQRNEGILFNSFSVGGQPTVKFKDPEINIVCKSRGEGPVRLLQDNVIRERGQKRHHSSKIRNKDKKRVDSSRNLFHRPKTFNGSLVRCSNCALAILSIPKQNGMRIEHSQEETTFIFDKRRVSNHANGEFEVIYDPLSVRFHFLREHNCPITASRDECVIL